LRRLVWLGCIVVGLLCTAGSSPAQETTFGVGGFFDFYAPLFNFRDMYSNGLKAGGSVHFRFSEDRIAEVEFHHARFSDGSLQERTFPFSDGNNHLSPRAKADMTFNSVSVNWLFAVSDNGFGQGATPYLTFGTGLYDYESKVSGLIFPGQLPSGPTAAPDPTIIMEPINDSRTSFSASFGGGVLIGVTEKAAIDLRVRYNVVMGELRPFLVWDVEKTYPFNLIDVGIGLKFNLQ
jgi:opacity protein-like surface antigen